MLWQLSLYVSIVLVSKIKYRDPQEKSSRFTRNKLTLIFLFKHKIEHTNEQVVSIPTSKGN